jgi:hypothetical protein
MYCEGVSARRAKARRGVMGGGGGGGDSHTPRRAQWGCGVGDITERIRRTDRVAAPAGPAAWEHDATRGFGITRAGSTTPRESGNPVGTGAIRHASERSLGLLGEASLGEECRRPCR